MKQIGSNSSRSAVDIAWDAELTANKAAQNLTRLRAFSSSNWYVSECNMGLLHKSVLGLTRFEIKQVLENVPDHNINEKDTEGQTPLYWAARRGDVETVSILLAAGADKDSTNNRGARVLTAAIKSSNTECVRKILHSDCDINYRQKDGYMPLHHCCRNDAEISIIKAILDRGADVDAQTALGHTPLMIAAFNMRTVIAKFLIDNEANLDLQGKDGGCALHYAVMSGDHRTVHRLLSKGANHLLKMKNGETILHRLAYRNGDYKMVLSLENFELRHVNVEDVTKKEGLTALQIAERNPECDAEWLEMFRGLIAKIRSESFCEDFEEPEYFDASEHLVGVVP